MVFGRRGHLGARAVGEADSGCRALGGSDPVGVRRAHRGAPARRRVSGVRSAGRARSTPRGCSTPAPAFVRAVSVTRVVRLVSNGVLEVTGIGCGQSVASPSRRLAGHPKYRGLFARSRRGMAHSDSRVIRSVRGERPERFTCHGSGVVTVGVTPRRSAGHSRVGALSGVLVSRAHSTDRPTRKWSRRARRSLCDPVATARGSFATLDGQRKIRSLCVARSKIRAKSWRLATLAGQPEELGLLRAVGVGSSRRHRIRPCVSSRTAAR